MALETVYLLLGAAAALAVFHVVGNLRAAGARNIPGPFAAKFTDLYRFFNVSGGYNHESLILLHEKYGDNVRLGPRVVSIKNMDDVNRVYGVKRGFAKSEFYAVQQQMANGKATETLFTTLNEAWHARIKRPVANAYSMTTLVEYEPLVDRTIRSLFHQLDVRFANHHVPCPMFEWLQYYAFDVIGELTCSSSFGFLKDGRDVDGIIEQLNQAMDYNASIGQMPWLDYWLKKNPIWARIARPTGPVARFARQKLNERLSEQEKISSSEKQPVSYTLDFVDRFLRAKETHPDTVDDAQVLSYMITNMFAGSDTTAISLRAILYYTLKHPNVYDKILEELDEAHAAGRLSEPATWRECQQLPYFQAVVQEALRLHPAVGLILERLVPTEGLRLSDGTMLPAGTIVGASPWVMHRDRVSFGTDVDRFRPERWLQTQGESDEDYQTRLKVMNGATFTFGKGHRTCIGKNISLLEIYKLLPSLFWRYKLSFVVPDTHWKIRNSWFVRQEGMDVYISCRTH
ncbi:cytochrome P450 [Thozetella sp. PMI_491]|nr:cytochrome P450 [Thozetella sp. PMI_491]